MDFQERLHFVTHHTRAAMLQHSTLETCILTTKMLCHVIPDLLDTKVMPVGVGVIGPNEAARAAMENDDMVEAGTTGDQTVIMCSHRGDQADRPGEWWGGHLVLVAANRYLVDGSADQFDTPDAHFRTRPFILDFGDSEVAYEWLMGDDMVALELPEGACIGYEPHLEDFSYRPSMDWDETQPGDRMYEWVVERVRGLLEAYGDSKLTPSMLPPLPKTLSRKFGDSKEAIFKRELSAAFKLGYTRTELAERIIREEVRTLAKAEKHAAQPLFKTEAEAIEAGIAETRKAVETMEPKLLRALNGGYPHWFGAASSPLFGSQPVSSPPSSP